MTDADVPFEPPGSMSLLLVSTHSEEVHDLLVSCRRSLGRRMQQKARVQDADPCAVAPFVLACRAFRFESEGQNPLGGKMGKGRRTCSKPCSETISFKRLPKKAGLVGSERGTRTP